MIPQLARVEMRLVVRHPVILGAVALSVLGIARAIPPALPMSAAALLACHLCASRDVRHGTEEHLRSLPGRQGARTAAQLLSVAALVGATAALYVPYLWLLASRPPEDIPADEILTLWPIWPAVAFSLHGLARVLMLGVGGVLVGRLIPTPVAGPVAVVVAFFLSSFTVSPLWLWPEEFLTKTAAMLGLAVLAAVLAVFVEPFRLRGATGRA